MSGAAMNIWGKVVSSVGNEIKFHSNLLNTYMNYKIQGAAIKQQWANAQANHQFAVKQSNAALSGLAHNEYVLRRARNRQYAEVESAYVGAGVSSESGTWKAVMDEEARTTAEELVNMRSQVDNEAGLSMLQANNDIRQAEANYKWAKKANKWQMRAGMFNAWMQQMQGAMDIWGNM